jgi:hypothetical protein
MQRPPLVDEARPGQCPSCDAPSRPLGGRLGLIGHGLRERQQLGPAAVGATPTMLVLSIRRYRCGACGAVITVVPSGVIARRHYSASAIVLALALFGVEGQAPRSVRAAVSPWQIIGETASLLLHLLLQLLQVFKLHLALYVGLHIRNITLQAPQKMACRAGDFGKTLRADDDKHHHRNENEL